MAYKITDACLSCGACESACPVGAISMGDEHMVIDADACISCGLCEKICTSGCIEMAAGIPVWTQDKCNMCLACLNRCPATAIQYGKKTEKRGRYVHPVYQNEKIGEMTE